VAVVAAAVNAHAGLTKRGACAGNNDGDAS